MHDRYASRLSKLRQSLKKQQLEAVLITKKVNVQYLTGFTGDDSYLLVLPKDQWILSDFRFIEQLAEESPGIETKIRAQGRSLIQHTVDHVTRARIASLAFEAESLSYESYRQLESIDSLKELRAQRGLVETLREIKDRDEIEEIKRSITIAQRAFQMIRAGWMGYQTEKSVANELEYQIRRLGGRGCSFPPIVGVGARAALPHAVPSDRRLDEAEFTLVDWGACAGYYASDLTRMVVTGRISPKLERIYGVVLSAQRAAIEAIRPGAVLSDVDAAARDVISHAGYGDQFGHGLGHGIGLEIHEAPRLAIQQSRPLRAGMVVTVEPGIYLPGWGGIRIEDDILVTRTGHEILSDLPKDLDQCIVK